MDLDKAAREEELSVDLADTGLQAEDGLVSGHSQVDDTVVEADVLLDDGHLAVLRLFSVGLGRWARLSLLVEDLSAGIFELEWKHWSGLVYGPDLADLQFELLRSTINWLVWLDCLSNNFDDRLTWDLARVFNHAWADAISSEQAGLHGGEGLSDHNEALLSLSSRVVQSTTNTDFLTVEGVVNIFDFDIFFSVSFLGGDLRPDEFHVAELVSAWIVGVFDEFAFLSLACLAIRGLLGSLLSLLGFFLGLSLLGSLLLVDDAFSWGLGLGLGLLLLLIFWFALHFV